MILGDKQARQISNADIINDTYYEYHGVEYDGSVKDEINNGFIITTGTWTA